MARCYANENFSLPVVEVLRRFGHESLTTAESGRAGQAIPDADVLAFAVAQPLRPRNISVPSSRPTPRHGGMAGMR